MQVTLRGWSRDHGPKSLLNYDKVFLAYDKARYGGGSYEWRETYVDVISRERPRYRKANYVEKIIQITGSTELNLNGGYMVQVELDPSDMAHLFFLTHGAEEGKRTLKALEEAVRTLRSLYGLAVESESA